MSRAVNAVVIGIAVFILVAGSFWYLSVASGGEKLSVDSNLTLQSANEKQTRIVADLSFNNQHDVDVRLTKFSYEFRAGSLMLAKNSTEEELPLKPRTEHEESVVLEFPTDFVTEWLKHHVQAGEKTTVVFEGNATFQVGSRNQTISFSEERPFTTDIRTSLEKAENCPRPSPQPCVESISGTWRERNNTLVLDLALRIKNAEDEEMKVSHPQAALRWGETEVAKAEGGGVVIDGDSSKAMEFALFLQHAKLKEWWPDHLENCEKSPIALDISFAYQIEPEDRTTTTPSPTTVSSPPNITTSSSSPTTSTTTSSPSTEPTPSTSPTETSSSKPPKQTDAPSDSARVSYVFLFAEEEEEPENRTASWNLEGSEFRSSFVCDDPDTLLDLP